MIRILVYNVPGIATVALCIFHNAIPLVQFLKVSTCFNRMLELFFLVYMILRLFGELANMRCILQK